MIVVENDIPEAHDFAPRVPGQWLMGNALQLKQRPLYFLVDSAEKFGPIFRLKSPEGFVTVISGPAGEKLVRKDGDNGLHRRGLFHHFSTEAGVDIFGIQGQSHASLRSLVKTGYSRQIPAQFVDEMSEVLAEEFQDWRRGQQRSLFESAYRLAMVTMMRVVTPIDLSGIAGDMNFFGNAVMSVVTKSKPKIILMNPKYNRCRNRVYSVLDEVIARHKAGEFASDPKFYMTDAFLSCGSDQEKMADRDVRGGLIYAIAGSEIYIGRLVGFLLYELLRNRFIMTKVVDEIDCAFGGREIDANLFRKMKYLRSSLFETLRMYPLLPGLPFRAERDLAVGGFLIPKGELVLVTNVPAHFSSEFYPNPFVFDPERCMAPRREHLRTGAFAPFGCGKRTCVAVGLNEVMVLTIVSMLLRDMRFKLSSPGYRIALNPKPLIVPTENITIEVDGARRADVNNYDRSLLSDESDLESGLSESWQEGDIPMVEPVVVAKGDVIFRSGDRPEFFYIILTGSVSVDKFSESFQRMRTINKLKAGQSFGERGLLKGALRTTDVTATEETRLLQVDRAAFQTLIADTDLCSDEVGAVIQKRYMRRVIETALPALANHDAKDSTSLFQWQSIGATEVIFRQGETAEKFFILATGKARVEKVLEDGSTMFVRDLMPGDFFGELGMLTKQPRTTTVTAVSNLEVLTLGRQEFSSIMDESAAVREDLSLKISRRLFNNFIASERKSA